MAQCRSNTVGTGIPTADDNDVFTLSRNELPIFQAGIKITLDRLIQEWHGVLHSVQFAAFDVKRTRLGSSATKNYCIILIN
ncbi:hypothetical protein D3C73_1583160 [compost metagenome]